MPQVDESMMPQARRLTVVPGGRSTTSGRAMTPREPLWRHVLGDRLRALRHERGETLVETSRRAGVSPQYLSEMERGAKDPSSEMIAAVAGALGTTLVDLTSAVADTLRSTTPEAPGATCRAEPSLAA